VTADYFAGRAAETYDECCPEMFAPDVLGPTVELLAGLAGDGRALEFAIGTGRVAVALQQRGVPVSGIELSPDMAAQLRAKLDAADIDVVVGDMATTKVDGTFRLVYLVYNTAMNLTTQDEQVACFANAASHLEQGGSFVIEVMVPQLQRLPAGETLRPFLVGKDRVGFDEYDVVTQRLVSHHHVFSKDTVGTWSMPARYVWPSELDLMARLAGMTLQERWADWSRAPFTADSRSHVSVYRRD
jgi:hypothetical protein